MKNTLISFIAGAFLVSPAFSAISISGAFASGLGGSAPSGSLVLFVVDTGNNGFLNGSNLIGDLLAASDPKLNPQTNIDIGGTFGGDPILGRATVSTAGQLPSGFTIENTATFQNRNFALVWFNGLTSSATTAPANTTYGILRGLDWVMPSVNNGESFSTSATFINFDNVSDVFARVTVSSGTATNDVFATSGGAIFQIVPETSTTLLGALGALALMRRRRR
jgi:hypothetical protein